MNRKMKDSDVQWLGEIPSDWKITNLKKVSKIKTGSTPSGKSEEKFSDISGLEWIKTNNLLGTDGISESKLKITSEYEKKATLAPLYSTLVCCIGDIGKLGFNIELVSYNQQINAVNFNNDLVNWKYGFYSLYAQKDQHIAHSNGNVLRILNTENQKKITISIPSMKEQIIIVKVLDKKTTEIDNIVEKTKQSIEELKAYKQSLITETVTKGLNSNVSMKESNITNVGRIPIHWNTVKLGNIVKLQTGATPSTKNDILFDGEYNWYTPSDLNDFFLEESSRKLNRLAIEEKIIPKYPKNSVLVVGIGASIGKVAFANHECSSNQQITALIPNPQLDGKYLAYYMLVNTNLIRNTAQYTTLPIMNNNDFSKIYIALPDLIEQKEIVNYLDIKNEQIDNLIIKKEKMIKELESYKQSLIYEYVTGKKEVE